MTSPAPLISRLESAETGSRELSDEVLLALGFKIDAAGWWLRPNDLDEFLRSDQRPDPTRSFDDAVGLVPEGWAIDNAQIWPGEPTRLRLVETVWKRCEGQEGWWRDSHCGSWTAQAATFPLALSAALLRAREAGG